MEEGGVWGGIVGGMEGVRKTYALTSCTHWTTLRHHSHILGGSNYNRPLFYVCCMHTEVVERFWLLI